MKIILLSLTFFAIIVVALGAASIELTDNTVDHPGHCFSKNEKVGAMEKGEEKTIKGECAQASCKDDTSIHHYSCGVISAPNGCKVGGPDLTKPYPKCCTDIVCN